MSKLLNRQSFKKDAELLLANGGVWVPTEEYRDNHSATVVKSILKHLPVLCHQPLEDTLWLSLGTLALWRHFQAGLSEEPDVNPLDVLGFAYPRIKFPYVNMGLHMQGVCKQFIIFDLFCTEQRECPTVEPVAEPGKEKAAQGLDHLLLSFDPAPAWPSTGQ